MCGAWSKTIKQCPCIGGAQSSGFLCWIHLEKGVGTICNKVKFMSFSTTRKMVSRRSWKAPIPVIWRNFNNRCAYQWFELWHWLGVDDLNVSLNAISQGIFLLWLHSIRLWKDWSVLCKSVPPLVAGLFQMTFHGLEALDRAFIFDMAVCTFESTLPSCSSRVYKDVMQLTSLSSRVMAAAENLPSSKFCLPLQ